MNIVCFGDSLTYGTGSSNPPTTGWPALLQSLLNGQTVTNLGVPGETSAQILARVQADTTHKNDIHIFWAGHNDPNHAGVADNIAAMVAAISPNTNYLVLSTITRTYEPIGSDGYNEVVALNATLAAAYGSKFVDVLGMLVGAYNPKDAADISDHVQGLIPDSLRAVDDTIHLNDGGYALDARQISQVLFALGLATDPMVLARVIPSPTRATDVLAVYSKTGQTLPLNVLVRDNSSLHGGYVSAGYFRGAAAVLDVSVDILARALRAGAPGL